MGVPGLRPLRGSVVTVPQIEIAAARSP